MSVKWILRTTIISSYCSADSVAARGGPPNVLKTTKQFLLSENIYSGFNSLLRLVLCKGALSLQIC